MFGFRQSGIALIEVLVAALILGMGVMGLSAAQLRSLHEARQSWWQWQAETLAAEMAERVRASGAVSVEAQTAWHDRVASRLPAGRAEIEWPSGVGQPGQIVIEWQGATGAAADQRRYRFQP